MEKERQLPLRWQRSFPWGTLELQLEARCGRVIDARIRSDAREQDYLAALAENLPEADFSADCFCQLAENLAENPGEAALAKELCCFFREIL